MLKPRLEAAPWGFLGMLVLVVAIDRYQAQNYVMFSSTTPQLWNHVGLKVERVARGNDLLCFGDSQVAFGVAPAVLARETGLRGFNFALFSGSAPSSYFLFQRALRGGARPSAVVVDFDALILTQSPHSGLRPYPWAELLNLREAFELCLVARNPDLFARILAETSLYSLKKRQALRKRIVDGIEGDGPGLGSFLHLYAAWRHWNRNQGAMIYTSDREFHDVPLPPPGWKVTEPVWQRDPTNEFYLRAFLNLAEKAQVQVYWLLPPVSPGEQAKRDHSETEQRFLAFVSAIQRQYPRVVVLDARHSGFGAELFADHVHLAREGAVAFSTSLGKAIRAATNEPARAGRWIGVPECQPAQSLELVEDFRDSIDMVFKQLTGHPEAERVLR